MPLITMATWPQGLPGGSRPGSRHESSSRAPGQRAHAHALRLEAACRLPVAQHACATILVKQSASHILCVFVTECRAPNGSSRGPSARMARDGSRVSVSAAAAA